MERLQYQVIQTSSITTDCTCKRLSGSRDRFSVKTSENIWDHRYCSLLSFTEMLLSAFATFTSCLFNSIDIDKKKSKFRHKECNSANAALPVFVLTFAVFLVTSINHADAQEVKSLPDAAAIHRYRGDSVTMHCPIASQTASETFTWIKEGSEVKSDRKRVKVRKAQLRIRRIESTDSGWYLCQVTDEFGRLKQRRIELLVADSTSTVAFHRRKPSSKPTFSQPVKMRRHDFVKPQGGTVSFRCKARGRPRPQIQWFKDGNYTGAGKMDGGDKSLWVLTLRNVQEVDSGVYTCRVWNTAGEISFDYTLRVVGTQHERPVLLAPHPVNTSVVEGERTSLQCRVRSSVPPTVKWIKRLDQDSLRAYDGDLPANALRIDKKYYLVLPTQEMVLLPDLTYLNKLVIRRASLTDTGMYICVGANTMGYNYRYAYLTVKTALKPTFRKVQVAESNSPLPLVVIVTVPAALGLLIVLSITFYCVRNRERLSRWSRDQEARRHDRSKIRCEGASRLSSVSTGNIERSVETQETVDCQIAEYTPASTFERPKEGVFTSIQPTPGFTETDVASTYRAPPSPPPPSQYSEFSSSWTSSSNIRSNYSCSHHSSSHRHHHQHRSKRQKHPTKENLLSQT